ncbi:MAG: type IV pilus assembly protein FimV [Pseudohongiellaceae bacterium]
MWRKNLTVLIALISCFSFSGSLWAVGLGQLRADSSINQPLSVRIQLTDLGSTPLDEINVAVADADNFERLGVDVVDNFPEIQITLGVDEAGPYARLESASVIRTPYLEVVLDTRWPSGRVLTQHTILLDPPVFLDSEEADVADSAPPGSAPRSDVVEEAVDASITSPRTVTTDRSSTLYSIALASRPNQSVTVQQTMLAIQRLNPTSFADGNINRLYAGEILRLPTEQQILQLSAAEALEAVLLQNQEAEINSVEQRQISEAAGIAATAATGDQLSVVVTETAALEKENSVLGARIEELENRLAISQEELAKAARERVDFIARLEAIESQITAAQEIIKLQDAQLAELTQSLAAAAETRERETPPAARNTVDKATGFFGQPLIAAGAAGLAVLLLVLLLLRRNRESHEEESPGEITLTEAAQPITDTMRKQEDLDRELLAILADGNEVNVEEKPRRIATVKSAPAFDPEELTFRAQEAAVETSTSVPIEPIDEDEAATKLELAYAYHKMGDNEGAAEILLEVLDEGSSKHKAEAQKLLDVVNASGGQVDEDSST